MEEDQGGWCGETKEEDKITKETHQYTGRKQVLQSSPPRGLKLQELGALGGNMFFAEHIVLLIFESVASLLNRLPRWLMATLSFILFNRRRHFLGVSSFPSSTSIEEPGSSNGNSNLNRKHSIIILFCSLHFTTVKAIEEDLLSHPSNLLARNYQETVLPAHVASPSTIRSPTRYALQSRSRLRPRSSDLLPPALRSHTVPWQ